jgi:aspartate/methionine/tyrosine aminotransferase
MDTSRTSGISSFIVMDVLEKAAEMACQGIDVVHLEIGEPDFDTPEPVTEAAIKALREGHTHYTHSLGLPELREAICAHYADRYGAAVEPGQVIVTNGTSPAMFLLFGALLEPGDEVILSDPHYACYPNFVRFCGGEPVKVRVHEEDGFQFRATAIRERLGERTRGVFINSPSNPTGNLLSPERMQRIAALGVPVISDEIYHGLVYEGREHSILEFTDNAFVFNGFSKLYAMTGLRLGYLIAPKAYMRVLQKLAQNFFISANTVSQYAGIAALTQCAEHEERMRAVYNERRVFLIRRLKELGFGITVEPTGAFYVLANAKHLAEPFDGSSFRLAFDILEKACVGVTPGIDFGEGAEGYIRFSYANSLESIAEGMDRLERYVRDRG